MQLLEFLGAKVHLFASYALPFVVILAVVIFIHELGHFLVGRWCGVGVKAFSLGFGPELAGFDDRHGTRWKLCAIPLGGYVKFEGDANGASLPAVTAAYLTAHPGTVYAVGGPAAKADPTATAIVGVDRYATAADLATRFFAAPTLVGVATGVSFPDALSGGAQLARVDAPLLLATPTGVPAPIVIPRPG